jgi:peptidoglycan/LPS O-acetylase OafA/YrhL
LARDSSKLRSLEGIRGVAAVMVLLLHLQSAFCLDFSDRTRVVLQRVLGNSSFDRLLQQFLEIVVAAVYDGGFAVWVFWVMSAVVLSQKFFELSHRRLTTPEASSNLPNPHQYLVESTIRRYPRLVIPVLGSTLFAYVIHNNGWMMNQSLASNFGEAYRPWLGSFYGFVPNVTDAAYCGIWQAFFQYDSQTTYNPLLWTIEKEMWGSLFLFASCALLGQFAHRWIFYIVAMLIIWKIDLLWLNAFVSGMAISDLVVLWRARGGVTALPKPVRDLCESRVFSVVLFAMIWFAVGLPNYGNITNWIVACIVTFAAILLPPLERGFSWRLFQFLGGISFGLYLIHFPIMCSFSCWFYSKSSPILGDGMAVFAVVAFTLLLSIFGAVVFTMLLDRPAIRLSKQIGSWVQQSKPIRSSSDLRQLFPGENINATASYAQEVPVTE